MMSLRAGLSYFLSGLSIFIILGGGSVAQPLLYLICCAGVAEKVLSRLF